MPLRASGGGYRFLPFFDLQLHHSSLCLCCHMANSLGVSLSNFSCSDTNHIELGPTLMTSSFFFFFFLSESRFILEIHTPQTECGPSQKAIGRLSPKASAVALRCKGR